MCKNILILQIWKHMSVERWRIPTKLILILCKLHLPSSLRFIPSLTDTTLPLACLKTHPDHLCSSYTLQWGACPGAWSTCQGLKKKLPLISQQLSVARNSSAIGGTSWPPPHIHVHFCLGLSFRMSCACCPNRYDFTCAPALLWSENGFSVINHHL